MAKVGRVNIRLPSSIRQGEVIRVRTLVMHPMEIVQRDKANKIIPKNYQFIHTMTVAYNGKEVIGLHTPSHPQQFSASAPQP